MPTVLIDHLILVEVTCRWCPQVILGEVESGARYRLRCKKCGVYRDGTA